MLKVRNAGPPGRMPRMVAVAVVASLVLTQHASLTNAAPGGTSSITGFAFADADADGVFDPSESVFSGHQLYLFAADGAYLGTTLTGADGAYRFDGLADGPYLITYAEASWAPMRQESVPTTTGSAFPELGIQLAGLAVGDFGWRAISRSTTYGAPISSFSDASGLRVDSYVDAVEASTIHQFLASGLMGNEAASVEVVFGLSEYSSTSTSVAESGGTYSGYAARVYVTYDSWLLDRGMTLAHEYGHAWSLYHAYITQGEPTLAAYLAARGLETDGRVDSSYVWSRRELIAEDYRQLLGPPAGRSPAQANSDLPGASSVSGLADFLRAFATSPVSSQSAPPTTQTPSPSASAGMPSPSATPFPTPLETPAPTPSPSADPTPAPTPGPTRAALMVTNLVVTPTPVTRSAVISFDLSTAATTTVVVQRPDGTTVATLARGALFDGVVGLKWDRRDDRGRRVKAGTYRVVIDAASDAATERTSLSFPVG